MKKKTLRGTAALLALLPLTGCTLDGLEGYGGAEENYTAEETEPAEESSALSSDEINSLVDDLLSQLEQQSAGNAGGNRPVYFDSEPDPEGPQLVYTAAEDHIAVTAFDPAPDPEHCGLLVVPETVDDLPVTAVGDGGFSGADYADYVYLPDSVNAYGDYAFSKSALSELHLYQDAVTMGDYAFMDCVKLTDVSFLGDTVTMGEYCFDNCGISNLVTIDCKLVTDSYCFKDMPKLETVDLTGGAVIGEYSFENCPLLSSVVLTGGSYEIMDYAFQKSAAETLVMREATGTIGEYCFDDCSRLSSIIIEDGVTEIGDYSFMGCRKLTSVTLPASVKAIGAYCFAECGEDLVITAPAGSCAQQFAEEHGFQFVPHN